MAKFDAKMIILYWQRTFYGAVVQICVFRCDSFKSRSFQFKIMKASFHFTTFFDTLLGLNLVCKWLNYNI